MAHANGHKKKKTATKHASAGAHPKANGPIPAPGRVGGDDPRVFAAIRLACEMIDIRATELYLSDDRLMDPVQAIIADAYQALMAMNPTMPKGHNGSGTGDDDCGRGNELCANGICVPAGCCYGQGGK